MIPFNHFKDHLSGTGGLVSSVHQVKKLVVLTICVWLVVSPVYAVKLRYVDEKGTRVFVCDWFCGKVKVKRIGRCTYRVFSVNFNGEMDASSEKDAARIACLEKESPYTSAVERPSTGTGACEPY